MGKSIEHSEKTLGRNHKTTIIRMAQKARRYQRLEDYAESIRMYEDLISRIKESTAFAEQDKFRLLARNLNGYAAALRKIGRLDKAEHAKQESKNFEEKVGKPNKSL